MSILRLDDLFITYGDEKFAEVAVFVDLLRALQLLYQTSHWQVSGPNSYSDHLLFERLYKTVSEEIDGIGEKAVGLGNSSLVNYRHSLENMTAFLSAMEDSIISDNELNNSSHVSKALKAESAFLKAGEKLIALLKERGLLSKGLDNLLSGVLDSHEGNIYLLKQRNNP